MRIFRKTKARTKGSDGTYKLDSFWTHASTVEFDDGSTLDEFTQDVDDRLDGKGDKLLFDNETNILYLLSGNTQLSSVEIISSDESEVLGDVSGVTATVDGTTITLKWTDPSDGTTVSWGGTIVVRKKGSRPADCLDGTVVVDSTTRNAYQTTGYDDENLDLNSTYFYRFFPYTDDGKIRTGTAISIATPAGDSTITTYPTIAGTYTYTGSQQTVQLNDFDSTKMAIEGNTATNAGTYTVTITPKAGYTWIDNSNDPIYLTWTIRKAQIAKVPTQKAAESYEYRPGVSLYYPPGYVDASKWNDYNSSALYMDINIGENAGTYTGTATPRENYEWTDGTTTPRTITYTIDRCVISQYPYALEPVVYDGTPGSPFWENYSSHSTNPSDRPDPNKYVLTGQTSATEEGTYTVTFTPGSNYIWDDGTTTGKNFTWVLEPITITGIPTQLGTLVCNGETQTPKWDGVGVTKRKQYNSGVTPTIGINISDDYDSENMQYMTKSGETSGQNAGTYTVTYTPKEHYQWWDGTTTGKTSTWTIGKATITNVPSTDSVLTYNGSAQSPTWNNYDNTKMTRGGVNSATDAGTYTANFTPTSNYQWNDETTSVKHVSWSIGKADGSVTLSKDSVSLTSSNPSDTVTVSGATGNVTVSTGSSSIATATINNGVITITKGSSSGSTTITVSVASTTNYFATTKTISVEVESTISTNMHFDLMNPNGTQAVISDVDRYWMMDPNPISLSLSAYSQYGARVMMTSTNYSGNELFNNGYWESSSSDTSVATVTKSAPDCYVMPKKAGTAVITHKFKGTSGATEYYCTFYVQFS